MLALYDKNNIGVYLDTKSVENQFDYNKIIIRNAKLTPMVLLHKKKIDETACEVRSAPLHSSPVKDREASPSHTRRNFRRFAATHMRPPIF